MSWTQKIAGQGTLTNNERPTKCCISYGETLIITPPKPIHVPVETCIEILTLCRMLHFAKARFDVYCPIKNFSQDLQVLARIRDSRPHITLAAYIFMELCDFVNVWACTRYLDLLPARRFDRK